MSNQRQFDLQRTKRRLLRKKNDRNQVRPKPGPEHTRDQERQEGRTRTGREPDEIEKQVIAEIQVR